MQPKKFTLSWRLPALSRRRFVTGAAAGGALLALGIDSSNGEDVPANPGPQFLTGNRFDLTISSQPVNFTRRKRVATAVNGTVPGPCCAGVKGSGSICVSGITCL